MFKAAIFTTFTIDLDYWTMRELAPILRLFCLELSAALLLGEADPFSFCEGSSYDVLYR